MASLRRVWVTSKCTVETYWYSTVDICYLPSPLSRIIPALVQLSNYCLDNIPPPLSVMLTKQDLTPVNRARNEHKTSDTKTSAFYYTFIVLSAHYNIPFLWHGN